MVPGSLGTAHVRKGPKAIDGCLRNSNPSEETGPEPNYARVGVDATCVGRGMGRIFGTMDCAAAPIMQGTGSLSSSLRRYSGIPCPQPDIKSKSIWLS